MNQSMNTRVVGLFGSAIAAAKSIVRSNSPLLRIKLLAASRIAWPPHEAVIRPYRSRQSKKHWIKVKNRKHPAMHRRVFQSGILTCPAVNVICAFAGGALVIGGTLAIVIAGAPGPRGVVCTTWLGGSAPPCRR